MGFMTPKVPNNPPPPPTPPSITAGLKQQRTAYGQGQGSLAGTFLTGPAGNPLGNLPGSTGQSGMKHTLGS